MNTNKKTLMAGIGAVALCTMLYAAHAYAAGFVGDVESGSFFTLDSQAVVNNSLSITVTTPLQFGTFGTVKDPANTDTATASLTPADVFTGDTGGAAKIIDAGLAGPGDLHTSATITVAAFPDTQLFVDYSGVNDLVNGGQTLTVTSLQDNLNTPNTGVGGTAGNFTLGNGTPYDQGSATTTAGGALVFHIGGSFRTAAAVTYASGLYSGDFDMTISY